MILGEPGALRVAETIRVGASISTINLAEVIAKLIDRGFSGDEAITAAGFERLRVVEFSDQLAVESGLLRAITRSKGLSLGDRCCLATAIGLGEDVLTADRNWADIDLGVMIELCR